MKDEAMELVDENIEYLYGFRVEICVNNKGKYY